MKPLLRSALWYLRNFECNIVFEKYVKTKKGVSKPPVHSLRPCREISKDLYTEKMTAEDVVKLFDAVRARKPTGLGLICNLSSRNLLFLDFDDWQLIWNNKVSAMLALAKTGAIVYETPRGFRVLYILDRSTRRFSNIEILYKGQHVGEGGGVLSNHKWTVPPSYVVHMNFFYRFIDENGKRIRYPWEIKRFSTIMWADSIIELLSSIGIKLVVSGYSTSQKPSSGKHEEKAVDKPRCGIELLNGMSGKQLIAFLVLVMRKANKKSSKHCVLEDIFMEWFRKGVVPIRKFHGGLYHTGDVSRGRVEIEITYRMLMLNTIAGILRDFGMNLDRIGDFLADSYRDLDGEPEDSIRKALYAVRTGRYDVTMKGECPWCMVYALKKPCSERPLSIVRRVSCEEAERLASIVIERVK